MPVTERPDYERMAGMLESLDLFALPITKKTYHTTSDIFETPLNDYSPRDEHVEQMK